MLRPCGEVRAHVRLGAPPRVVIHVAELGRRDSTLFFAVKAAVRARLNTSSSAGMSGVSCIAASTRSRAVLC
jgi:hypothetical protein